MSGDDIPSVTVYTRTGWREIGGHWSYLHGDGAVVPTFEQVQVRLDGAAAGFRLPAPPTGDALRTAVRASLAVLDGLVPGGVAFPLLATAYRAALGAYDYRIADNQTATLATWDEDKLPLELLALQQADFDLALTGFPEDELLRFLTAPSAEAQCDPDEVPEPAADPITQPGDLWSWGCTDCCAATRRTPTTWRSCWQVPPPICC